MIKTVKELADLLGGRLDGHGDVEIDGVASLKEATFSKLSFLGNPKYESLMLSTGAGVVLVAEGFNASHNSQLSLIFVKDPSLAFSAIVDLFAPPRIEYPVGVHPTAVVAFDAKVANDVHIGAHVTVEAGVTIGAGSVIAAGSYIGHEVVIGSDCLIYPNVTIRERSILGSKVIIHSGTVIGSDGFGFNPGANGHIKIPQVGTVQIDDDVEIGANVTVDRARFGKTWIKTGAKLDNLVQIGHNVVIGRFCFIIAQVGISGSTIIGDRVIVAGQAGISGHLEIGEGAMVMGQSGVSKDLEPGEIVIGSPAVSRREFAQQALLAKKVKKMEQELKELKSLLQKALDK